MLCEDKSCPLRHFGSRILKTEMAVLVGEVTLYEDELCERGICTLTAKLRVMPKCW